MVFLNLSSGLVSGLDKGKFSSASSTTTHMLHHVKVKYHLDGVLLGSCPFSVISEPVAE